MNAQTSGAKKNDQPKKSQGLVTRVRLLLHRTLLSSSLVGIRVTGSASGTSIHIQWGSTSQFHAESAGSELGSRYCFSSSGDQVAVNLNLKDLLSLVA
jgi:hypothetical protein